MSVTQSDILVHRID